MLRVTSSLPITLMHGRVHAEGESLLPITLNTLGGGGVHAEAEDAYQPPCWPPVLEGGGRVQIPLDQRYSPEGA